MKWDREHVTDDELVEYLEAKRGYYIHTVQFIAKDDVLVVSYLMEKKPFKQWGKKKPTAEPSTE
jgi:hypothetical protein